MELFASLAYFHFLRPAWLWLIPVTLFIWWRVRFRVTSRPNIATGIAPHLATALTVGNTKNFKWLAIDGVAITLILISVATAGPAWDRIPNPLVAQTAPLVVAISLSESMNSTDIPPSRAERAGQKFLDILATRAGAKTALIVYAGTAHKVVPLTEDPEVLKPFIEGLSPEIMPSQGHNASAALTLARNIITKEQVPGAILFITDNLDSTNLAALKKNAAENGPPVVILSLGELQHVPGVRSVRVTANKDDITSIERIVAAEYRNALANDDRLQWNDRGWLIAWPALFLILFWFRRGWTMQWCFFLSVILFNGIPNTAQASGIQGYLFTNDQQARFAFEDKRYVEAAEKFEDPLWKGYALYSAGKYAEAAKTFALIPNAEGAFAQGTAHVKGREYREGIRAFEKSLLLDPTMDAAVRNLKIARAILQYIERVRDQSDTQEGSEGADDYVFDKSAEGGKEIAISGKDSMKLETAEQWMRGVNTRTADFLRIRFALESSQEEQ